MCLTKVNVDSVLVTRHGLLLLLLSSIYLYRFFSLSFLLPCRVICTAVSFLFLFFFFFLFLSFYFLDRTFSLDSFSGYLASLFFELLFLFLIYFFFVYSLLCYCRSANVLYSSFFMNRFLVPFASSCLVSPKQ